MKLRPIHDADDFTNVRDDLSGYYVLAQDVDLSSYSTGEVMPSEIKLN